jgi:hypothetical protein
MKRNDYQTRKHLVDLMEYVRSIDCSEWNAPYAVTLNFWNGTKKEFASRDITHFLNRLDAYVYKNAYRKYGKRLKRVGVFEGTADNPHYHLLLESPKHINQLQFRHIVESFWGKIRSGQTYIWSDRTGQRIPIFKMEPIYSGGWSGYISKTWSKESADDADVMNWHLHSS